MCCYSVKFTSIFIHKVKLFQAPLKWYYEYKPGMIKVGVYLRVAVHYLHIGNKTRLPCDFIYYSI